MPRGSNSKISKKPISKEELLSNYRIKVWDRGINYKEMNFDQFKEYLLNMASESRRFYNSDLKLKNTLGQIRERLPTNEQPVATMTFFETIPPFGKDYPFVCGTSSFKDNKESNQILIDEFYRIVREVECFYEGIPSLDKMPDKL